jgi:F-type H+-transporting ATPase subunit gamma
MDAAARNIEKKLDRLRRDERVARQEKTTADMLDVVTGAEAVNHG